MIIIQRVNRFTYHPRLLEGQLERSLSTFPVAVVTGARQTGKSTLVRTGAVGSGRTYITLDDPDVLERALREPDALLRGEEPLTLDEVQRAPELLLAVKRSVDERKTAGRYLLTGSANLLLMQRVSESLAGRAMHLVLTPLTRSEQNGAGRAGLWGELLGTAPDHWPDLLRQSGRERADWRALARHGGYPTPALELENAEERRLWFAGYTQTYLERDLREIVSVASLPDFRRLMRACCLRLGGLVNQSEIARDIGMPQPTVHRHLGALEISHQVVRLPPFSVNRTKRLIKSPKLYWSDTGLALFLAGEEAPRGPHLENLVLSDLLSWQGNEVEAAQVSYWRTTTREEVDFVLETSRRVLPIEVKASARLRLGDARALGIFLAEYADQAPAGLILYTGSQITWMRENVLAVPWWLVI